MPGQAAPAPMLRIHKRPKHDVDDEKNETAIAHIWYIYIDTGTSQAPMKYSQRVSKEADIDSFKKLVAITRGRRNDEFFVCEVRSGRILKIYQGMDRFELVKHTLLRDKQSDHLHLPLRTPNIWRLEVDEGVSCVPGDPHTQR